jgi:hypothetical protein
LTTSHTCFVFVAQFWPTHCIEDLNISLPINYEKYSTHGIGCFFDCIIFLEKRFLTQEEKGMTIKDTRSFWKSHMTIVTPSFIFVVAKLVKQHGHASKTLNKPKSVLTSC